MRHWPSGNSCAIEMIYGMDDVWLLIAGTSEGGGAQILQRQVYICIYI